MAVPLFFSAVSSDCRYVDDDSGWRHGHLFFRNVYNNVTFTRSQLEKIKPKTNLKLQGRLSECLTFFVTHTKRHKSRDDCRLCVAPTDEGDSTYDEPIRWEWKKKKCSIAIAVKSSAAVERIRNVLFPYFAGTRSKQRSEAPKLTCCRSAYFWTSR